MREGGVEEIRRKLFFQGLMLVSPPRLPFNLVVIFAIETMACIVEIPRHHHAEVITRCPLTLTLYPLNEFVYISRI